jgi:ectoine hydroxylase-related dioxygenase (phytanoyl-CoA dioxygenase family)
MTLDEGLERLERDGYVLIEGALSPEETERCRLRLNHAREQGWQEGLNAVGNMWFDRLLQQDPETFAPLVAHPSVRPYLEALLGPQCQLRSYRAHINPGAYHQEWHMDFFGYWREVQARYAQKAVGINTTFYFQDNGPGLAWLKFVRGGHRVRPEGLEPGLNTFQKGNPFEVWCDAQPYDLLYPKAGDAVLFFSHIPHQGAKEIADLERSNVVCHYQCTPMYDGVWHVSQPLGYQGTFPLGPRGFRPDDLG